MRRPIVLLLTLVILGGPASALHAQSAPALTRIGYMGGGAALGTALGAVAGAGESCDGFVCIPTGAVVGFIFGGGLGLMGGNAIASGADDSRVGGRPLSDGQMVGLTVGSALGGAVLGAVAGAILIKPDGPGTFLGTDEQTLALLTAAGTGLGIFRAIRFRQGILPRGVEVRPGAMRDGSTGVVTSVRF